jgi:hypothetical protein
MVDLIKMVSILLILLLLLFSGYWIIEGNDFFMYKFFAPKYANMQREVFENTKSYKQGTIQDLENERIQYYKSDNDHKDALSSIILHQIADFPEKDLPYDLIEFKKELNNRIINK